MGELLCEERLLSLCLILNYNTVTVPQNIPSTLKIAALELYHLKMLSLKLYKQHINFISLFNRVAFEYTHPYNYMN